jgi:hypothetical protein
MEESPVGVRHSAGILDLKDWINPLHGYQYDSMNKDALLHQPFNYKALVIPTWTRVSPETKTRIEELRQQGVLIIDKPYEDAQLKNMNPDVVLPEGIAYTHRTDTDCDIYFLANQQDQKRSVTVSFRCIGRTPYIYNPVTDEWFKADYTEENGRTNVTLTLSPYGSLFVSWGGTNSSIGWNNQFHGMEQTVPPIISLSKSQGLPLTISNSSTGANMPTTVSAISAVMPVIPQRGN